GHRPSQSPQGRRQRRPQHDKVEMARVVGEVNALPRAWIAADPAGLSAAEQTGDGDDERGGHRGARAKRCRAAIASGRITIDGRAWRNRSSASATVVAWPVASRWAPTTAALRE